MKIFMPLHESSQVQLLFKQLFNSLRMVEDVLTVLNQELSKSPTTILNILFVELLNFLRSVDGKQSSFDFLF